MGFEPVSRRRVALRAAFTIRHHTGHAGRSFGVADSIMREESGHLGLMELPLSVQVEERSKLIKYKNNKRRLINGILVKM